MNIYMLKLFRILLQNLSKCGRMIIIISLDYDLMVCLMERSRRLYVHISNLYLRTKVGDNFNSNHGQLFVKHKADLSKGSILLLERE